MRCLKLIWLLVALACCAHGEEDSLEYFDVGDGLEEEGSDITKDDGSVEYFNVDETDTSEEVENSRTALIAKQPVLGEMSKAQCECQKSFCMCCSTMPVKDENHELCLVGWANVSRLAIGVDILFDRDNIYTFEVSAQTVGTICVPLPFPPPFDNVFKVCIGNYHLNLDLRVPTAMVCLYGVLKVGFPLFTMDMNCIKLDNTGFSWTNEIEFDKKGLLHLNINCMDPKFEVNVPDIVKTFAKDEAERFVTGWNEKDTLEDKSVFLAETYWRYCPINYIIQGVEKIAPHIPGAVEYVLDEASAAIQSYAQETALEMSKMTSNTDKALYLAKRLYIFTPAGLMHAGYQKVAPFVEGILEFAGKQIASSLECFFVDIMKEAATYNNTLDRMAFLMRKQMEYSPAGLIAKAVTPIVVGVGEMAFNAIKKMAEKEQNKLIEKLKKTDNPAEQALIVVKTLHSYTPAGMIASFMEEHIDTIAEEVKNLANKAADNFMKNLAGDPEKMKTTGGQILHGVTVGAKLLSPIGWISMLF